MQNSTNAPRASEITQDQKGQNVENPLLHANLPHMRGKYSTLEISDSTIIKHNYLSSSFTESPTEELGRRKDDAAEYLSRLKEIGVLIPETTVEITHDQNGKPRITMCCKRIPAPHNLIQIGLAPHRQKLELLCETLRPLLLVGKSQQGTRGVGVDSGFDNLISHEGRCYLVDIYPPRLMYTVTNDGGYTPIPFDKLLVNYPENETLILERQNEIRNFYYTPKGNIEHFMVWAISSMFADSPEITAERALQDSRTSEAIQLFAEILRADWDSNIAAHVEGYLYTTSGITELRRRFISTPKRFNLALEGVKR